MEFDELKFNNWFENATLRTSEVVKNVGARSHICDLFKKIYCLWNKKEKNYTYECTSILYQIIAKTSVTLPKENKNVISPAIKYINEYFYFSDFSLEKAYSLCNVSRSYFNRTFKQLMKTTPIDYINGLKINKAKLLLSSGAYTHSEIANLCGFSNVKYFYIVLYLDEGCVNTDLFNVDDIVFATLVTPGQGGDVNYNTFKQVLGNL